MKPRWRIGLEEELQDQLRLPGSAGANVIGDRCGADPEVCIREVAIGIREVGMVKNVEQLAAELDGEPLVNVRRLCKGGIPLRKTGAAAGVPAQIAEFACGRRGKGGRINLWVKRIARSIGARKREINPAAFAAPPAGEFGDLGRN